MSKLKVSDIANCFTMLFDIEVQALVATVAEAKRTDDENTVLMGQSYLLGLQRASHIINTVLKDVKDE